MADVKVELNEGNSICDDYGVGDIEEENDPHGDDGDYEPVMKKRGRKPKKKFGPQEESGHRAKGTDKYKSTLSPTQFSFTVFTGFREAKAGYTESQHHLFFFFQRTHKAQ